jgi:acyl-coenzyme A thioesterase PaaI-like protein
MLRTPSFAIRRRPDGYGGPVTIGQAPDERSTFVTPARLGAAAALRRLNHALVAHDCDDQLLIELKSSAHAFSDRLERGAHRDRAAHVAEHAALLFSGGGLPEAPGPNEASDGLSVMSDRAVGGIANPTAVDVQVRYEGDEAVATVTLAAGFEGAPGRAHGGIVAAVFDDVTGYVLRLAGSPAFTGRLSVTYHAPTPLCVPLEFRSRIAERRQRTLLITAECRHGATVLTSAEATFVMVDPNRFRDIASEWARQRGQVGEGTAS